ncbi:MAG: hypothetical protein ACOCXP_04450, partial [Candidatus Dojkabacteria bacterium]
DTNETPAHSKKLEALLIQLSPSKSFPEALAASNRSPIHLVLADYTELDENGNPEILELVFVPPGVTIKSSKYRALSSATPLGRALIQNETKVRDFVTYKPRELSAQDILSGYTREDAIIMKLLYLGAQPPDYKGFDQMA